MQVVQNEPPLFVGFLQIDTPQQKKLVHGRLGGHHVYIERGGLLDTWTMKAKLANPTP